MSLKLILPLLLLLVVSYLAGLSFLSRYDRVKPEGQRNLEPCPGKPNCVFSLAKGDSHAIKAFPLMQNNLSLSWKRLISAIEQNGGKILVDDGNYCHAVFTSRVFRFKDDFEAKSGQTHIDVRSASRAGSSDLGQNRKRVEKLRTTYLDS